LEAKPQTVRFLARHGELHDVILGNGLALAADFVHHANEEIDLLKARFAACLPSGATIQPQR